ncbi:MAG: substrate-binding domain-containing protein [Opitutaceae bacterium]|nr:substrate-binding domain-containing protein [Opitutaceae bacterium]
MKKLPRSLHSLCALFTLLALISGIQAVASPTNVLIRVPAGSPVPAQLEPLLAQWRQSGQVASVLLLTQGRPEKAGEKAVFEALAVLEFPTEGSYQAWRQSAASALPSGLIVRRADALTHGELTPRDSNRSVFVVNTYTPTVARERYNEFVQGYIAPLYEAQRATKRMVRYTMYLEHEEVGKAAAIAILEYRDPHAFATNTAAKGKIREELTASHPTYAKFHDIKDSLRIDSTGSFATYTELPPPDLSDLPAYKPEFKVVGGLRIIGSELKNAVDQLAEGFHKFHPEAKLSTSHIPSSEGGIAALYFNLADVAPMGDDAKITDMMPFYNTFGYLPTEISVATGGFEKRGSLWAFAVVVSKDNPLEEIGLDELKRIFGSERSGGWEIRNHNYHYTSKLARSADTNIRKWGQLGLKGEYANREIETFGYASPGFSTYFERNWFHWSKKWNPNFREYVEPKQATPDEEGSVVTSLHGLEQIAQNKYAIGLAAMMHVVNNPGVKVLRISPRPGALAIALTPENVANRTYPLRRDAFFYVNKPPGRPLDPKAREFMRFVLSREGQEIIARVQYYYPLKADYLLEQLKKLD